MGIDGAVTKLIEQGILGIGVVFLAIAYIRKDKQVTALYTRLVEKSERDAQKYHELAETMDGTLKEMSQAIKSRSPRSTTNGVQTTD